MPETTPWDVPGTTSNLDHDDKRPDILAGIFTTWGIATIFVCMRLWTRARIVRVLGVADLLITISLVGFQLPLIDQGQQQEYLRRDYLQIFAAGMCAAMVYG